VFEAIKEKKQLSKDIPLKTVLKSHRGAVVLSMLVTWMLTAGIMVIILMTPTLIQNQFQIPAELAFKGNNLASFCLVIGCLAAGLFADKIGYVKALFVGSLVLTCSNYALYLDLMNGGANFLPLYALAGFTVGVVGIVPSVMIGAFPPIIRFSGLSFSYNMSYAIFGALTPPFISYLSSHFGGLAPAHYVAMTTITCMGLCVMMILRREPEDGESKIT
jgi:MFS family permease